MRCAFQNRSIEFFYLNIGGTIDSSIDPFGVFSYEFIRSSNSSKYRTFACARVYLRCFSSHKYGCPSCTYFCFGHSFNIKFYSSFITDIFVWYSQGRSSTFIYVISLSGVSVTWSCYSFCSPASHDTNCGILSILSKYYGSL